MTRSKAPVPDTSPIVTRVRKLTVKAQEAANDAQKKSNKKKVARAKKQSRTSESSRNNASPIDVDSEQNAEPSSSVPNPYDLTGDDDEDDDEEEIVSLDFNRACRKSDAKIISSKWMLWLLSLLPNLQRKNQFEIFRLSSRRH